MKRASLLHTTVNAGHFSQIVWKNTKYLGVGKSVSKTGKIFVVGEFVTWALSLQLILVEFSLPAFYYPPGNIVNEFHENVLPPAESKHSTRPNSVNSNAK